MTVTPEEQAAIARDPAVEALVRRALEEDGAARDVTTLALVDPEARAAADLLTRQPCRTAGASVAALVFSLVDPDLRVDVLAPDGTDLEPGGVMLAVEGRAASILTAERTALNLAQRMTGIATAVRRYVELVAGTGCRILDTRKTAPGMRVLDKYAVKAGGGTNHRMGLSDMVLVKDNHRKLWRGGDPARLDQAVEAARARPASRWKWKWKTATSSAPPSPRLPSGSCSTTCPPRRWRRPSRSSRTAAASRRPEASTSGRSAPRPKPAWTPSRSARSRTP